MAAELNQVVFGDSDSNRLIIEVLEHPDAEDYWDENELDVIAGPWSGSTKIGMHCVNFGRCARDWTRPIVTLIARSYSRQWSTISDGRGHVSVRGTVRADSTEVSFEYGLDQSYIPAMIEEIRAVENLWPVVGRA